MKKVAIIYPSSGGSKDDLEFGVSLLEDAGLEINIINYKTKMIGLFIYRHKMKENQNF